VNGTEVPIGRPVRDYTPQEYSAVVYGRGPLFLETLAETMGTESFSEFLKDYYQTYQWGIATGEGLQQMAEKHCDCDLSTLFNTWVYDLPTDP
jgi:aminopeptidase N